MTAAVTATIVEKALKEAGVVALVDDVKGGDYLMTTGNGSPPTPSQVRMSVVVFGIRPRPDEKG